MKKIKQLLLSTTILFSVIGCGVTESESEINPNKNFDLWEYMTSPLNYEIEYRVYENGEEVDYYIETNKVFDKGDTYERRSETGRTLYYLNNSYIVMKEPSRDVEISRYIHVGDSNIFRASDIDNCRAEEFHNHYTVHKKTFNNVLMINCLSKSGVKQELYYGYSEGIVAIYQDNNNQTKEYVKIKETALF